MGEVPATNDMSSVVSHQKRKGKQSGGMTAEEIRLNKQILKEISKKKKERLMSEVSQSDINLPRDWLSDWFRFYCHNFKLNMKYKVFGHPFSIILLLLLLLQNSMFA